MPTATAKKTATLEAPQEEAQTETEAPTKTPEETKPSAPFWLLHGNVSPCEKFEVEGAPEPFYIRRLDFEGIFRVGLFSSVDEGGLIMFAHRGHLSRVCAACFFVALATDETGKHDLFESIEQAREAALSISPSAVNINQLLFNKILEINPNAFTKVKGGATDG